jgi:hypothetical protein
MNVYIDIIIEQTWCDCSPMDDRLYAYGISEHACC